MAGEGSEESVVVHYRDVTQQKQLRERLQASERLASLGQLASGAAHEINNPMGFLVSNLKNLKTALEDLGERYDAQLLEDSVEMIDESLQGANRVSEIVRALRQLSKLEIGTIEPSCVNSSVSRVVRAEYGEGVAHVTLELNASAKALVAPLQLDEALGNILHNARQAVTGTKQVIIRTREEEAQVVIEIEDEGCGIPADHLRRLFEPFFSTRGIGKGVGLGLTAAYGIVKRNAGDIEVRSEVGKGSIFTVRLPRAAPQAATLGAGVEQPAYDA
jgi:two-component system, NtrC family, sensor kinase